MKNLYLLSLILILGVGIGCNKNKQNFCWECCGKPKLPQSISSTSVSTNNRLDDTDTTPTPTPTPIYFEVSYKPSGLIKAIVQSKNKDFFIDILVKKEIINTTEGDEFKRYSYTDCFCYTPGFDTKIKDFEKMRSEDMYTLYKFFILHQDGIKLPQPYDTLEFYNKILDDDKKKIKAYIELEKAIETKNLTDNPFNTICFIIHLIDSLKGVRKLGYLQLSTIFCTSKDNHCIIINIQNEIVNLEEQINDQTSKNPFSTFQYECLAKHVLSLQESQIIELTKKVSEDKLNDGIGFTQQERNGRKCDICDIRDNNENKNYFVPKHHDDIDICESCYNENIKFITS